MGWDDDRLAKDYMRNVSLADTRIWFIYRSRVTVRVKTNRSSAFRDNVDCRHCDSGEIGIQ